MTPRTRWQGALTIARFNWPFYLAGLIALIVSAAVCPFVAVLPLRLLCLLVFSGAAHFVFGSLLVSHVVYDRSDLYRFAWLKRITAGEPTTAIVAHAGFDEVSAALAEQWPHARFQVLDHFDAARMTEPSIRRARRCFPPTAATLSARFDRWPVETASTDVVFGLLAIHELRSEAERSAWFTEARRSLTAGGCVVIAEHTRDPANFLAFGPGFLHFHSPASWRRCWESAGFHLREEFRVTPFVRFFVLTLP